MKSAQVPGGRRATGSSSNKEPPRNEGSFLSSALGTNTSQVCVDSSPNALARFYRAWQTNGVAQAPLLSMTRVPAITLRGAIGGSVQIDYINQIGPTDPCVTLATVTLTNTSQLYFDTAAIGRPARLYRLLPVP